MVLPQTLPQRLICSSWVSGSIVSRERLYKGDLDSDELEALIGFDFRFPDEKKSPIGEVYFILSDKKGAELSQSGLSFTHASPI